MLHALQAVDGVEPISEGYNPATWMLEVTGTGYKSRGGVSTEDKDFPKIFNESQLGQGIREQAAQIAQSAGAKSEPLKLTSRFATTTWQQFVQVTRKLFLVYWYAALTAACQLTLHMWPDVQIPSELSAH